MKITKAQFVKGVVKGKDSWSPAMPQVAFYGRSNVGKSSSINALVNNASLAKTSGMPGKTKEINLFNINDKFYLVDLPGYGFARGSREEQDKIQDLISWYVTETRVDKRIHVLIIDAKVGITDLDLDTLEFLYQTEDRIIMLLNKIDRLNQSELAKVKTSVRSQVAGMVEIIPFSAKNRKGVVEFWKLLAI